VGFDPATMAVVSLVGSGIGAIGQASGAQQTAQANAAAASYQAQVAANNQIIANQNAEYATQAGEQQATVEGLKNRSLAGTLRTDIAANNIDVNTGSAADVQTGQRQAGLLDVQTVRQNAALQSYGYRTQASNFGAQQGLQQLAAANDIQAGNIAATSSLLSGATSVADKFSKFSQAGIFGNNGSPLLPNNLTNIALGGSSGFGS
jgi:hypothetical protein